MPQQQFKGYSEDQMRRIASKLGHTGDLNTFDSYLGSNPKALGKYNTLKNTITQHYARGGMVKSSGYDVGGDVVRNLYKTLLGREPEAGAAEAWSSTGKSLADITAEIGGSTEGKQRATAVAAGNTNFQRYVAPEFQDTTAGYDYNTTAESIDRLGRTGDNTAADAAAIQQIYQNQVGRAAETGGATAALAQMASGTNLDTIRANVAGSDEAQEFRDTGQQRYVAAEHQVAGTDYRTTDQTIDEFGRIVPLTEAEAEAAEKLRLAEEEKLRLETELAEALAANDAARIEAARLALSNANVNRPQSTFGQSLGNVVAGRATAPGLVAGANAAAIGTATADNQIIDNTTGQLAAAPKITSTGATTTDAAAPTVTAAPQVTTTKTGAITPTVGDQGTVGTNAQATAQTQDTTNVGNLDAAQSTSVQVNGAPTRTLEGGEIVNPVADAQTAAAFTEQINAAQADPSSRATVQGQLATLMTSFDAGKTPAWAAGAMRNVTAQMSARGIGSSSMAGQALIQAALESALPIATADAQTFASFEMTNLNNKQQRAMLSAQQRATFMGQEFDQKFQSRVMNATKVSEVANMRFTASQQIALENSQAANTMRLSNLSNKQAIVMAAASTLSQLEVTSLNNRQAAEQQNAQSFLDMDMTNLSNTQQATMFDAQSKIQSMLTDAAADNASKQFNATSTKQTDQFFAGLKSQISQFNATQANAQSQFNAGETNTVAKFNTEIANQRDQFNSENRIVIDQSNAQWRRDIATADTVAINRANEINAKSILDISNSAYNDLWQDYRDKSEWAWTSAESGKERFTNMALQKMKTDGDITIAQLEADYKTSVAAGAGISQLLFGSYEGTFMEDIINAI